jgi:hypothetical protein
MSEPTTNRRFQQADINSDPCVLSALFVPLRLRCARGLNIPRCGSSTAPTAHDSSAPGNAPRYAGALEIARTEGARLGQGPLLLPHLQPVGFPPPLPGRVLPFQGGTRLGDRVLPGRVPWAEDWCAFGAAGVRPDHRLRAHREGASHIFPKAVSLQVGARTFLSAPWPFATPKRTRMSALRKM